MKEAGLQVPRDLSVLAHDDGLEHYDLDAFDPPIGSKRSELGAAWSALASTFDRRITHPDIEPVATLQSDKPRGEKLPKQSVRREGRNALICQE